MQIAWGKTGKIEPLNVSSKGNARDELQVEVAQAKPHGEPDHDVFHLLHVITINGKKYQAPGRFVKEWSVSVCFFKASAAPQHRIYQRAYLVTEEFEFQ